MATNLEKTGLENLSVFPFKNAKNGICFGNIFGWFPSPYMCCSNWRTLRQGGGGWSGCGCGRHR